MDAPQRHAPANDAGAAEIAELRQRLAALELREQIQLQQQLAGSNVVLL